MVIVVRRNERSWAIRDPLKRKVAKQNGLRHIEFWSLDQAQTWLSIYGKDKRFSNKMLTPVGTTL